jgi:thiol-disulfide isomerase/thioredoxin
VSLPAMSAHTVPPPLVDGRISFKQVAVSAASCVEDALCAGHRRVSIDIPPIGASQIVARQFENDNSFMLQVVEHMGGGRSPTPVGESIEIRDNWRASGEYLSAEGLYGYRFPGLNLKVPLAGAVTLVGNSEIGCSALSDLEKVVDGRGCEVLFNLALDRLSFFDKLGLPSFDDVEPAYLLRRVGSPSSARGFVTRNFPGEFALWRANADGELELATSQAEPISPREIDRLLRLRGGLSHLPRPGTGRTPRRQPNSQASHRRALPVCVDASDDAELVAFLGGALEGGSLLEGAGEGAEDVSSEELEVALLQDERLLVDVYATWCGPCLLLAPQMDTVASALRGRGCRVLKFDSEQQPGGPELATRLAANALPTLLFIEDGSIVHRVEGALQADRILELVEEVFYA